MSSNISISSMSSNSSGDDDNAEEESYRRQRDAVVHHPFLGQRPSTRPGREKLSISETIRFTIDSFRAVEEEKEEEEEVSTSLSQNENHKASAVTAMGPPTTTVITPGIRAHGQQWTIRITKFACRVHRYQFSIGLQRVLNANTDNDPDGVTIKYSIINVGSDGTTKHVSYQSPAKRVYPQGRIKTSDHLTSWIVPHDHLAFDTSGSLIFDVTIQVYRKVDPVWYPARPTDNDAILAALFESAATTGDVTMVIRDDDGNNKSKEFRAHKAVLAIRAPLLFEMVWHDDDNDIDDDEGSSHDGPVTIPGVDAVTFRALLAFLYTGKWPTNTVILSSIDLTINLLMAANRFGCTSLKLYMESILVDTFLDENTAARLLVLADSHACAQLKEAAVKLYVSSTQHVVASPDWSHVAEAPTLHWELFRSWCRSFPSANNSNNSNNNNDGGGWMMKRSWEQTGVAELRNTLSGADVGDIDGTREAILKRVKRWEGRP